MQIVPMRDLKDTVKIENMCVSTQAPVFITKNGYGRLVVMDIECFERLMGQIYDAKMINEGLEDVKAGKVSDANDFLSKMKEKYGF